MEAALDTSALRPARPDDGMQHHAAPELALEPLTPAELDAWFRGGEPEADACERLLARAARARGAIDVALVEGLHALQQGDRLAQLGYHLDDYAREVLDLGRRATQGLVRLGAALRTRPLLREALRSGRVGLRAAETVVTVAVGDAEASWVERARVETVRGLERAVRAAHAGTDEADEEWLRLRTQLPSQERLVVDEALAAARTTLPGSTRVQQLEALAQEFLAEFSKDAASDEARPLGAEFRASAARRDAARRAALEAETERWAGLPDVDGIPAPELSIDEPTTARELDERLRSLARHRAGWERLIGFCGWAVKRSGLHLRLGYGSFRHYVEERLGLPARAVEQRVALEKRLWESPALREAQRRGVSYERLRVLARLSDADISGWTPRALEATCIALQREVDGEREGQLRARQRVAVSLPRRVAVLLSAALHAVRERFGRVLSTGTCLAVIAFHFLAHWTGEPRRRSRSQRIRERDHGWCQVPGCSHRAVHSHHIVPRARGGTDDPENLVALCAFHHLRCIHGGYLAVSGCAPDELRWRLGGDASKANGRPTARSSAREARADTQT